MYARLDIHALTPADINATGANIPHTRIFVSASLNDESPIIANKFGYAIMSPFNTHDVATVNFINALNALITYSFSGLLG
jgi:hypothetical protein